MLYYTVESLYLLHSRCVGPTVVSASLPIFSLLCRLADAVGVERCQETSNIWWQSNRQEEEEQVHSQQKKKEKKIDGELSNIPTTWHARAGRQRLSAV